MPQPTTKEIVMDSMSLIVMVLPLYLVLVPLILEVVTIFRNGQRAGVWRYLHTRDKGIESLNTADLQAIKWARSQR